MISYAALVLFSIALVSAFTWPNTYPTKLIAQSEPKFSVDQSRSSLSSSPNNGSDTQAEITKAPTLNGKAVLPIKAMVAGLKGHKVAAVYAVLNSGYKRG